jgi:hypothetical protein
VVRSQWKSQSSEDLGSEIFVLCHKPSVRCSSWRQVTSTFRLHISAGSCRPGSLGLRRQVLQAEYYSSHGSGTLFLRWVSDEWIHSSARMAGPLPTLPFTAELPAAWTEQHHIRISSSWPPCGHLLPRHYVRCPKVLWALRGPGFQAHRVVDSK